MILSAILAALTTSVILLLILIIYMKYRKPQNGYRRMSPTSLTLAAEQRDSRAASIFSMHGRPSIQENGKAPEFDIPLISRKATGRPKRTCQLHFSLFYNVPLNELTVQVIQAQSLPKLFGLQSGVLVKVKIGERVVNRC